ncbi:hypothetical protein GUITHDRAFT_134065 [Guillardia theta CCMP2712]|uniref:PNPLA domain-containing protein n=1 Tax=Guillardia theta (strain CCMP2712) TaxID=905079 RepID=L1JSZ4_GUITC|nr:hypothetical protein GUITHDRAFT_134065 [Guillardia theta CCMP2712]EKX51691.1 hypothetical protein GUITHDRAFT_134065 [Guillardia theta CCMP2712]|eukprot:XP_005838671.1 hypothetical protein GUITHDRAFT_134065 [Guillardia theta CCMP2712]
MASGNKQANKEERLFSFAACGWLKIYLFGVAKALQETGMANNAKFVGSSAGSLVGLALALDLDFEEIKEFQLNCVKRTHGSIRGALRLKAYLDEIMDQMLPEGACDQINDSFQNVSKCTTSMAPLCGMPFVHDGDLVYDGAVSDCIFHYGGRCILHESKILNGCIIWDVMMEKYGACNNKRVWMDK